MQKTNNKIVLGSLMLMALVAIGMIAFVSGRALRDLALLEPGAIARVPYSELETVLFKQARESVFKVIILQGPIIVGSGTGFLASIEGKEVIVTAGHVCPAGADFALDQDDDLFSTEIIAVSDKVDVCYLTVSKRIVGRKPYTIKPSSLPIGQQLAAVGHAGGGRLTQYLIRMRGPELVTIDGVIRMFYKATGAVYPGQSGGPVVDNIDGTAVALISATDFRNAYVTPAADIISEYKRLTKARGK